MCEERKGTPDRNFSLAVQFRSSIYTCWRCNFKGKLEEDLSDGVPEVEVDPTKPEERKVFEPPDGFEPFKDLQQSIMAGPAWDYILGRLPLETVLEYVQRRGLMDQLKARLGDPSASAPSASQSRVSCSDSSCVRVRRLSAFPAIPGWSGPAS